MLPSSSVAFTREIKNTKFIALIKTRSNNKTQENHRAQSRNAQLSSNYKSSEKQASTRFDYINMH